MKKDKYCSQEQFEKFVQALERRFELSGEKFFEHRGYRGRVSLRHDNDTGSDKWVGDELSTGRRFSGGTLAEAERKFQSLVNVLIATDDNQIP